jgi:hypothetical protein
MVSRCSFVDEAMTVEFTCKSISQTFGITVASSWIAKGHPSIGHRYCNEGLTS